MARKRSENIVSPWLQNQMKRDQDKINRDLANAEREWFPRRKQSDQSKSGKEFEKGTYKPR
jgi:hypothetical protein